MSSSLAPVVVESKLTVAQAIDRELLLLRDTEQVANRGYARLAGMLVVAKLNEVWRDVEGCSGFGDYVKRIANYLGKSHQQIHAYITAAEKLLPLVGEGGLDKMGITKATELVRAQNKSGKALPPLLLEYAQDPGKRVDEIRALAHVMLEVGGEKPKGRYLDIGGFYVDDEQYKTFVDAVKISQRVLNLPQDMPDWQQRQRIIMFWAQEIHGTYAAEVFGPAE